MTGPAVVNAAPVVRDAGLAFSPVSNPLTDPFGWALDAAVNGIADTLITILSGVWQAGLWLLELAFRLVDAFTTPDLSANGPIGYVLPITLWLGGFVAVVMFFVQLGLALVRRDGQSIGRVFLGLAQFAIVWGSFVVVGAGVVAAASGLTHGILSSTLDVDVLASWEGYRSWPREGVDVASSFVLAITSLLLLIPAAFTDVLVALVREAALIVLTAVAPIAAAGLLSDVSRAWFWKSLRWFLSAAFIAPGSALVLGIGVRVSNGVIAGAGAATTGTIGSAGSTEATTSTAAAVGMGVVGAALVAVAAIAPLTLFRLLSFVEPSTVSGAAMRQAWADFSNRGQNEAGSAAGGAGAGTAAASDGAGRAQGEATASTAAESRVSSALGMFGRGMQLTTSIANRAVDLSTDILGSAGVGHPGYSMTPADERALRASSGTGGDIGGQPDPAASPPSGTPSAPPGQPGTGGGAPAAPTGPPAPNGPAGGASPSAPAAAGAGSGAGAGAAGAAPVVVP